MKVATWLLALVALAAVATAKESRWTLYDVKATSADEYVGEDDNPYTSVIYFVKTRGCPWDVEHVRARVGYDPAVEEGRVRGWITFYRDSEAVGTCDVVDMEVWIDGKRVER